MRGKTGRKRRRWWERVDGQTKGNVRGKEGHANGVREGSRKRDGGRGRVGGKPESARKRVSRWGGKLGRIREAASEKGSNYSVQKNIVGGL